MRTSNPYLREKAINRAHQAATDIGTVMTVEGTVNKISILLLVLAICATASWSMVTSGSLPMAQATPIMIGGFIGTFILSIVVSFKPHLARTLAVPFAACEGLLLGVISAMYQFAAYPDIVLHAVLLTMGTALSMFLLWRTGVIKVTNRMRSVVCAAMGGIVLVYLMSFIMGMFGVSVPMIHGSGVGGIGFSVAVLLVVSFMLLIDFDMIERMAKSGQPKSMEWFGAFALLITLVWLYLEFLRLLSKLNNR